jgi:chromosome segregation ATPase
MQQAIDDKSLQIFNMEKYIEQLEGKIKALEVMKLSVEMEANKIPTLRGEIDRLKKQLAIETQNWTNIIESCKVKEHTISTLQKQLSEVQYQREQDINLNTSLNKTINSQKKTIDDMTATIITYKSTIETKNNEMEFLKSTLKIKEEAISSLKQDLEKTKKAT